jgi:hypothetical protein
MELERSSQHRNIGPFHQNPPKLCIKITISAGLFLSSSLVPPVTCEARRMQIWVGWAVFDRLIVIKITVLGNLGCFLLIFSFA